jgi:hypothetical protein
MRRVSTAFALHVDRALRGFSLTHSRYGALAQLGPDVTFAARASSYV